MNNKKWLLCIIIAIVLIAIGILLILNRSIRFNKLVVNETKWNEITSNKKENNELTLNNLKFNDYNLIVDNENNIIYYSVVDENKKYNPFIDYDGDLVINRKITEEDVDNDSDLKIMIYDKESYKIYSLVVTNYPLINFTFEESDDKKKDVEIEVFDNKKDITQRVVISDGKLIIGKEDEYIFNLTKESPGRNKRKNIISILGMDRNNEFKLTKSEEINKDKRYIQVFINNEYKGLYQIEEKGQIKKIDIAP